MGISEKDFSAHSNIAILGTGSMCSSILQGLLSAGVTGIEATTKSAASAAALRERGIKAVSLEENSDANKIAASKADIVLLGVKPWMITDLLTEISNSLRSDTIVISVAAGITLKTMQNGLPAGVHAVRTMPNTPSSVGLGVTGICIPENTPETVLETAVSIFQTVGKTVVLPESQIDALSAVSGSGPAYLFWFTEMLTNGAKAQGFNDETARLLAEQTVIGAARLLQESGEEPAELRRKVTSPGGTTAQAIGVFQEAGFDKTVDAALKAAIKRAGELAKGDK